MCVGPEDNVDEYVEFHVRNVGHYLNDQDLCYAYARETFPALEELAEWGMKVPRDAEGKIILRKRPPASRSAASIDLDMMLALRAKARKVGAKAINKVQVIDLLTQGDRVVGAVGFNLIDGGFKIFKAKATALVNGACCYKIKAMWNTACGEGIVAAYNAGAEMRNAEFGNFYDVVSKLTYRPAGGRDYLYNTAGENVADKYVPKDIYQPHLKKWAPGPQPDIPIELILGMEKEVNEGRGPIVQKMPKDRPARPIPPVDRPKANSWRARLPVKVRKYGPPPSPTPEVEPGYTGELSCVKVDHDMKTSLPGLWAIGDTSYNGSAWAGAVPCPPGRQRGSGLMHAVFSALRGGPAAARSVAGAPTPEVNYAQVEQLKKDIFAPLKRSKGLVPADAVYAVQEVITPIKYNIRRSKDRLEEALSKIKAVQKRLSELWAKDTHALMSCHEAKSMATCAEMTFRAALMRTETRGWHVREDYPKRDDKNWLKWIILKKDADKMKLWTEPIPIAKYKYKPI